MVQSLGQHTICPILGTHLNTDNDMKTDEEIYRFVGILPWQSMTSSLSHDIAGREYAAVRTFRESPELYTLGTPENSLKFITWRVARLGIIDKELANRLDLVAQSIWPRRQAVHEIVCRAELSCSEKTVSTHLQSLLNAYLMEQCVGEDTLDCLAGAFATLIAGAPEDTSLNTELKSPFFKDHENDGEQAKREEA